ncbi:CLUMA_CG009894, isoform A [Clunio marinus]|uniref:CLUMA_CG009894, isoform A n=1 Tax=Clunio marinus TaxID=568069 RepID=A0A1J1IBT9_9DIPT|nr:CLUMA_CG009894, isoform A [Clunio marinus]
MRIRISKCATLTIVFINLLLFFVSWKYFNASDNFRENSYQGISDVKSTLKPRDRIQEANHLIRTSLTVIFRDFYHFDNDLKTSIDHLLNLIPDLRILIISDELPYPPINIFMSSLPTNQTTSSTALIYKENVQFFNLDIGVSKSGSERNPSNFIQTKYVLFMPDSFRLSNGRQLFQRLIKNLGHDVRDKSQGKILIVPFLSNNKLINYYFQIHADIPNWTLEYEVKNTTKNCNMFTQKHALLLETSLLNNFPEPFAAPFPEYFYLQAKIANYQLLYSNETLSEGKKLMTSYHSKARRKMMKKEQFKELYRKLQFKKVVKKFHFILQKGHQKSSKKNKKGKNGNDKSGKSSNNFKFGGGKEGKDPIDVLIEPLELPATFLANQSLASMVQMKTDTCFYGCEKNTKSCIGQIFNQKPFYLYMNRHTPPCCLEKLKTVFQYLVEELENTGIRYWLDNSALKDAIELNDLSNDAFEIDISFNVNDYNRSTALKRCFDSRPFTDLAGYYWIKATDGQYLKVQFSKTNEIHVNLLPFEIQNDKMVPKGFYGTKAKEFSIEFLHPMSNLFFLGRNVFAPNNAPIYLKTKGFKMNSER